MKMSFLLNNKKCTFIEFKALDATQTKDLVLLVRAFRSYLSALGNGPLLNRRERFINFSSEHRAFIDLCLISGLPKWTEDELILFTGNDFDSDSLVDLQNFILLGRHLFPYLASMGVVLPLEKLQIDQSYKPQSGPEGYYCDGKFAQNEVITQTKFGLRNISYLICGKVISVAVLTAATIYSAATMGALAMLTNQFIEKSQAVYTEFKHQSGVEGVETALTPESDSGLFKHGQADADRTKGGYVPPTIQLNQSNNYSSQLTSADAFKKINSQVGGSLQRSSLFQFKSNDIPK